jgi:pimeloyl-ACP methyl ester carboxylesterase
MPLPTVKGVGTFYREYGDTNKEHVLFIHGLGASSIAWGDIPDALSKYFHTITVDLIGSGLSEKPQNADYTIKGFSKFTVDFLIERIGIMPLIRVLNGIVIYNIPLRYLIVYAGGISGKKDIGSN